MRLCAPRYRSVGDEAAPSAARRGEPLAARNPLIQKAAKVHCLGGKVPTSARAKQAAGVQVVDRRWYRHR